MLLHFGATPPPYSKICDIFSYYERISTKFSVISLLAKRLVLDEKNLICYHLLGAHHPILSNIGAKENQG